MPDILPPGNAPAWADSDPANQIARIWADDMWPALWPKMTQVYASAATRDADLAGLGPTSFAIAYLQDEKRFTYWGGTAWLYLSPTSTSKAGKRMHWGAATVSTDASGFGVVTHGAGFTPTAVVCNLRATSGSLYDVTRTGNFTATTFTIRVVDGAGNAVGVVASIPISFFCGE